LYDSGHGKNLEKYLFRRPSMKFYFLLILCLCIHCASKKILITEAANLDNINLIKTAIDRDEKSIDSKDENGLTALIIAIINGNLDFVRLLVEKKANINLQSKDNKNPLLYAALYGHKDILDFLIQKGAIDNIKENGYCAVDLYNYLYVDEDIKSEEENILELFEIEKHPTPIVEIDLKRFFPEEARKNGPSEKTIVFFLRINEKGIVKEARIVSGNNPPFDKMAKEILKRIRFKPAYNKHGLPVKDNMRMPINFSLD
jgi:TonB family protein